MNIRFLILFLFFLSSSVNAATSFPQLMNDIIRGTPGMGTVVVDPAGSVVTTGSGSVNVPAGRLQIPVPTTVATKVSKAAVAKAAARVAVRAIPWVGTAMAVKEIADGIADQGVYPCPPPAFFCTASDASPETYAPITMYKGCGTNPLGNCATWVETPAEACSNLATYNSLLLQSDGAQLTWTVKGQSGLMCTITTEGNKNTGGKWGSNTVTYTLRTANFCDDMVEASGSVCTRMVGDPNSLAPIEEEDFNEKLARKLNANHDWAVRMKQQMDAVARANPGMETPIDYTNVPVDIKASPVTGPETQVSTRTINNPDGTTSTETIKEQTTVTPKINPGGTVNNPQISYPSRTVSTTTTTNNVTNVTNVVTNNINNPAPEEKPDFEFPTDYNREATQKKILEQLDGSMISEVPADQEERQKREIDAVDTSLDEEFKKIPSAFQPDKDNWFSWVWSPPVGQCEPSMFSGFVSGIPVQLDICTWIDRIREVIGFIFAIFGAISIYTNLFRRAD